jgi:microcystin-dependent protein
MGSTPVGGIIAYFGIPTGVPVDWLICDGSQFNVETYPDLMGVLGTSTVPNLCGYFLRGFDPSGTVDPDGKTRKLGSVQPAQIGPHSHTYVHFAWGDSSVGYSGGGNGMRLDPATTETNSSEGVETRPANVSVFYLIYAGEPQDKA